MTYEEEFRDNLKNVVAAEAEKPDVYKYVIGNTFNANDLPVFRFYTYDSAVHSHQARASQVSCLLQLDTNFSSKAVMEGKRIFDTVLEKPKALLGEKVRDIIGYDFTDIGEIIKEKVYRVEARLDILIIKY